MLPLLQGFLSLWPWLSVQKPRTLPQAPKHASANQVTAELQLFHQEVRPHPLSWPPRLTGAGVLGKSRLDSRREPVLILASPLNSLCDLVSASGL